MIYARDTAVYRLGTCDIHLLHAWDVGCSALLFTWALFTTHRHASSVIFEIEMRTLAYLSPDRTSTPSQQASTLHGSVLQQCRLHARPQQVSGSWSSIRRNTTPNANHVFHL